MSRAATRRVLSMLTVLLVCAGNDAHADEFDQFLAPLFHRSCVPCHGGDEVNGEVNLKEIKSRRDLVSRADLIDHLIRVIDANDMPPEGEPAIGQKTRARLLKTLKSLLREATRGTSAERAPIRRLNRFQYNNAVRDLFQLNRDIFPLPEKLMTRHTPYLHDGAKAMPSRVDAASYALSPIPGLRNVESFPKDLRAAHGFDNQANQLTLSPLLLDAFLRLSVSIVESPDFTAQNVGIWEEFFERPETAEDFPAEVRRRLQKFLRIAFRGAIEGPTLDRYTTYALAKLEQGTDFPIVMKKVASATLSSPAFLFRSGRPRSDQLQLASDLSFFLWQSSPDDELLRSAEAGDLAEPAVLGRVVDRMLADPKIERFLDTFPAQWMQLENILAATPDPQKQPYFRLAKDRSAGLQMVLEPLLLFDATFIENRPIMDLVAPKFGYQSEFLRTWYTSDLKPPSVDTAKILAENRRNEDERKRLNEQITAARKDLDALIQPIRRRLLKAKTDVNAKVVDLKPYAAWEFDGDLKSRVGKFDLVPHGEIRFQDGMVVLNRSYLLSPKIPIDLKAKTLEVWCKVADVNQRGGGVMGIQGPGDFFDTIVLGERKPRHWISGSNGFSRTDDFPESTPEDQPNRPLHLVMVYSPEGTRLYRNGVPYGKPFRKNLATFPKDRTSFIFGLRHLPAGGNRFLSVSIDKARFYNRALNAEEVRASFEGYRYISDEELTNALSDKQRAERDRLTAAIAATEAAMKKVPASRDPKAIQQENDRRYRNMLGEQMRARRFDRVEANDPRYGGIITNAAMLSMTSGPKRTHPIARGAWIIEVIFNDPPPPPPNDVPPLAEDEDDSNLTIRERFAEHRKNPVCASCHARLDPLGFALENFDITGRWRDEYQNGRDVDSSGKLLRRYDFESIVDFKSAIVKERRRFARAFSGQLLRFAVARELSPADSIALDAIVSRTAAANFPLRSMIREVVLSKSFVGHD